MEKYDTFMDKLECFDTEIFIKIPMILILRKINLEDKNLCETFLPEIAQPQTNAYN